MILHTIISPNDIFYAPSGEQISCEEISGRYLEWEGPGTARKLRRLISTNPADFLNPQIPFAGACRDISSIKNICSAQAGPACAAKWPFGE